MKHRRLPLILCALCLVALIGYSIYAVWQSPGARRVKQIDIILKERAGVEPFMGSEDVRRELSRRGLNLEGMLIDSIDVGLMEAKLRENPLFSDVEIYITPYTGHMKVEVTQKEACFLVLGSQRSYYVSSERGVIPVNPHYTVYVPIVTGAVSEDYARHELYDLVTTIKQSDYFRYYFGHIHVDKQEGVILTPRVGTTSVIMGHGTNWEEMLHKYRVFIEEVYPRTGDSAYEYVKLAYGDQVVARPRTYTSSPNNQ